MARRAWVASSAFLGLSAMVLLGFFLDSINNQGTVVQVSHSIPQHRQIARNGAKVTNLHNDSLTSSALGTHEPCVPQTNIVFIKTHKTASSTTAGILDMFAYKNGLTIAVPPDDQPYMHRTEPFRQDMVKETSKTAKKWREKVGFNLLSSHARYNKPEMDAVVHGAKYITILRDPGTQFPSAFVYFNFHTRYQRKFDNLGRKYSNVLEEFMRDPGASMQLCEKHELVHALHNHQFFDLGLDTEYADDWDVINATIAKLDRELDLVLIKEYLDESLILMRDLLCWSTDDILYVSRKAFNSSSHLDVSPELQRKIRQWNAADTRLYEHYNRTLWQRIAQYGPGFDGELRKFRRRLRRVKEEEVGSHRGLMRRITQRMQDMGIYVE